MDEINDEIASVELDIQSAGSLQVAADNLSSELDSIGRQLNNSGSIIGGGAFTIDGTGVDVYAGCGLSNYVSSNINPIVSALDGLSGEIDSYVMNKKIELQYLKAQRDMIHAQMVNPGKYQGLSEEYFMKIYEDKTKNIVSDALKNEAKKDTMKEKDKYNNGSSRAIDY